MSHSSYKFNIIYMSLCLWFLRDFLISKACQKSLIAVYMELGERRGGKKKEREREREVNPSNSGSGHRVTR